MLSASPDSGAATLDQYPGPMPAYRAKRAAGELKPDPVQELAAEKLQSLHRALLNYRPAPPAPEHKGWFSKLLAVTPPKPTARPKGLYIFGGVGRGKSMLMDLFFATSAVRLRRRVHFHAFMQEVHERLHRLRASTQSDPLMAVAQEIGDQARLLCFDEFQVSDIADAMILSRLFEALFHAGVIVVATSNRPPDDLYKDGLQRDRFLPFIELIKEELDVLELDNGRDYRRATLVGRRVYYTPTGPETTAALEMLFSELTGDLRPEPLDLEVKKRLIHVPRQTGHTAWFDFADLCARPLGPGDYLAIADRFETVFIANVPRLGPELRNEAKRFNTLIDTLYEAKTRVVISADTQPEQLFTDGDGAFEFERTASRLMEMQSRDYLSARHRPVQPSPARRQSFGVGV